MVVLCIIFSDNLLCIQVFRVILIIFRVEVLVIEVMLLYMFLSIIIIDRIGNNKVLKKFGVGVFGLFWLDGSGVIFGLS